MIDVTYLDGTMRKFDADDWKEEVTSRADSQRLVYLRKDRETIAIVNMASIRSVEIGRTPTCPQCCKELSITIDPGEVKCLSCGWGMPHPAVVEMLSKRSYATKSCRGS